MLWFYGKGHSHFIHKSVSTFIICRNLSEWKIELVLTYLVRNFQMIARNKLTAKCLLSFSHYTRPHLEYGGLIYVKNKWSSQIYTVLQIYVCFIRLEILVNKDNLFIISSNTIRHSSIQYTKLNQLNIAKQMSLYINFHQP